jgi:hypothetical protein
MIKGLDPLLCSNTNDCVREQKEGLLGQYKGQQKCYVVYYHERSNFKPLRTPHIYSDTIQIARLALTKLRSC